jgi:hypothetical protein
MVDTFPFPRITGDTPEKQIAELCDYLIQFKETLEFTLMNISTENLSPDLISKLNELGADIERSKANREDELTQISVKTLTVSDVCNSHVFEASVDSRISNITFSVDFATGNLKYATSL